MKKSFIFAFSLICLVVMFSLIFARAGVSVDYFYKDGCSHCINVENSGILGKVNATVSITKHDILSGADAMDLFLSYFNMFNVPQKERGTPFLVIKYSDDSYSYFLGDTPIIKDLESAVVKTSGDFRIGGQPNPPRQDLTFGAIVVAALIDSVNPCAFGVLIFLMISLLKTGSSKRALRYGIIYSFVVFLVYFLAGFGIFRAIQSLTFLREWIYIVAAGIVFVFAILELIDFFRAGKSDRKSILKIPLGAKPILESTAQKGTLFAIVSLGILVSLFELPCTGGIYLGILSLMALHQNFAWGYLLVYNLIFILPLVVLTLLVYKGTSTEVLQKWTNTEKRWMKLAAAIILFALGIYLLMNGM